MRRGIVILPVVGLLVAVLVLSNQLRPPVDAQDRTEERLTSLEARVGLLETAVASGAIGPNGATTPSTHVLIGTFTLIWSGGEAAWPFKYEDDQCGPSNESYADGVLHKFKVGATVTVKNEANEVIAIGMIEQGEAKIDSYYPYSEPEREHDYIGTCTLTFTVENVPNSAFYLLEVDDQVFPPVSHEELDAQGWTVAFTVQAR